MKYRTKKIAMTSLVGTLALATPVSLVVACGTNEEALTSYPLLPTYTAQADVMLALGIVPDYYPLQLNEAEPWDYLRTGLRNYMYDPESTFSINFEDKILSLYNQIGASGESWWNQQALESDELGSNPIYWQNITSDVLLYEHYLLDDDLKIIDSAVAPKHQIETTIKTNFRTSRDPFTRISKAVIAGLDLTADEINSDTTSTVEITLPNNQTFSVDVDPEAKAILRVLTNLDLEDEATSSDLKNDFLFIDDYHRKFLDNLQFVNSSFYEAVVDTSILQNWAFDKNPAIDVDLATLFAASTYTEDETNAGIGLPSYINSLGDMSNNRISNSLALPTTNPKYHHPIYEQQAGEIGAAPVYEGAMRDTTTYYFDVASQLANLANYGTVYETEYTDADEAGKADFDTVKEFVKENLTSSQYSAMQSALENADNLNSDIYERFAAMRQYFADLGANDKVFGIVTIQPGHGVSTVQSSGRFSFLYNELGFAQPIPNNISSIASNAATHVAEDNAFFNMDDHSWWWNLSNDSAETVTRLGEFNNKLDMGLVAANQINYDSVVDNQSTVKSALANIFINKDESDLGSLVQSYDLWSEGLFAPWAFHMALDQIILTVEDWYRETTATEPSSSNKEAALSWGTYFNTMANS